MTGEEFKSEIKTKPQKMYCLVSTDSAMVDLYLSRFKEALHPKRIVWGNLPRSGGLLRQQELGVMYCPKLTEDLFTVNGLFVYTDSIDKRSSIYRKYKGQIIELNNNYVEYVMKRGLSKEEAELFVKKCNGDLGIIKNALPIYQMGGTIPDFSNDIYLWVTNFIKGDPLPRVTESQIGVLALLSNNCQTILRVKEGDTADINPYAVKKAKELASYRTEDELREIILDCFILDTKVKQGHIDITTIMDYLMVKERRRNRGAAD